MRKFFSDIVSYRTEVNISVEIYSLSSSNISAGHSGMDYRPCRNNIDFQNVYQDIEETVTSKGVARIALKINLKGILKGSEVQEDFDDLDSFRHFLENEVLITQVVPTEMPTTTNYGFVYKAMAALGCFVAVLFIAQIFRFKISEAEEESTGYGMEPSL
jgi:hypothetical protein